MESTEWKHSETIADIYEELEELGIKAECDPDFRVKYPDLIGCRFRD